MVQQKWLAKLTILLTSLRLSLQACSSAQAPFPKIVGGTQGNSYFNQIDYHAGSGYLVVVGETYDQGVRGDGLGSSISMPIIIAYQATQYTY
ncbi:hypothetical protein FGO68_gene3440 [Halteria grandinella]|uniref:Uncharacterized protein n=1 Tax=Halteria grandinella TaxID=5974 RepID=A0A8J8NEL4_HALGN|nr:hypothetical protein FGO68_gene3440 [Halteria grandinella]